MNNTTHSSTGFTPRELNNGEMGFLSLDPVLNPMVETEMPWERKIQQARRKLDEAAWKRKVQAEKHGKAEYLIGQMVWIIPIRRSYGEREI